LSAPPWIRVTVDTLRLPSGRVVPDFYQVALPDFAVVVAQTEKGDVVSLRQYKHGVGRVSLLLPAGLIHDGEDPLACAKRELLEETGYVSPAWNRLGVFVVDGNRGCGHAHVFAAAGAERAAQPVADELEPLEVRLAKPAELLDAIRDGEMVALAHVSAFMLALGNSSLNTHPLPSAKSR
jgi:ADP-ribose pyrophosphatase